MFEVSIQQQDFDVAVLQRELLGDDQSVGALASFVGLVREGSGEDQISCMELEHYSGMTERSIATIVEDARRRWHLQAVRVVHRVGALKPGEQIVYVGVTGLHRGEAFMACEFIMDYLKTRAPFWKKEHREGGASWVDARDSDFDAAARWQQQGLASPK